MSRRNLNYWDSVSTLAGEVPNPAKTFPKALFGAVVLVTTTYALPLIVGLGVTTDIADWKLGYFASLAKQVQPPCHFDLLWTAGMLAPAHLLFRHQLPYLFLGQRSAVIWTHTQCTFVYKHHFAVKQFRSMPTLIHLVCVLRYLLTVAASLKMPPKALFILYLCQPRDYCL